MARLQKGQLFQKHPEDQDLLEDVLAENGQAIQITDVPPSIYGMILNLPFQRHPQAVFITMGAAVLISLGVVLVFIRKDWL
jgi:hypothetical protein